MFQYLFCAYYTAILRKSKNIMVKREIKDKFPALKELY